MPRVLFTASIVVLLGFNSLVSGGDWPQWGGCDNRNLVSDEKNLPSDFAPGEKRTDGSGIDMATTKNVRWVAKLGSAAYGNPTCAGGRVFVGTDDYLVAEDSRFSRTRGGAVKCFDEAKGELLWQLVVPARGKLPKELHYGFQHLGTCSSPTVDGDCVYVVTNAAEVLCLDVRGQANGNDGPYRDEGQYMAGAGNKPIELKPTDADILWRCDLIDDLGIRPHDATSCSVLVHGDLIYFSTSNGVNAAHDKVLAPNAPAIAALDKRTGKLAAFEKDGLSGRLYHCQWSSPSLGKVNGKALLLVGGGDGCCYAFEAIDKAPPEPVALKKVWSYDAIPHQYKYADGKLIPYYSGDKRKKDSPNKNDGKFVGPSQIIATPVFLGDRVYVAIGQDPAHGRGRGMLHCIDATKTGDITKSGCVWTYDGLDRTMSTVAVADGLVYVTDIAGRLHTIDADTGKPYSVFESKSETWGGPLAADGKLYFGNQKDFYILSAGKEPKIISKIRLGSPVCSTPIAANGTVYVASQKYLWAVGKP